jgi:hypothetical protein
MNMIWLTTPEGNGYFRSDEITAVTETFQKGVSNGKEVTVKANVYLRGQEEAFNVLEDCETVLQRMQSPTAPSEE